MDPTKFQSPKPKQQGFGHWMLEFGSCLDFGFWSLEFGAEGGWHGMPPLLDLVVPA
jgi:hypothetical protein